MEFQVVHDSPCWKDVLLFGCISFSLFFPLFFLIKKKTKKKLCILSQELCCYSPALPQQPQDLYPIYQVNLIWGLSQLLL